LQELEIIVEDPWLKYWKKENWEIGGVLLKKKVLRESKKEAEYKDPSLSSP